MLRALLVLGIGLVLAPLNAGAQEAVAPLVTSGRFLRTERVGSGALSNASWVRPVSSALVPGSGQLLAGQDRGAIYVVAETFFLARFLSLRGEGRRERDRFQELAFTVARASFRPARQDTAFEYFEEMEKFVESGPFDTDPGPALVPPTDERTFNGRIWALARQTFFVDPDVTPDPGSAEFQRALEFYRGRAIGPNFQWSWRNAGLEQDLFRQSIRNSDGAFRQATQFLGLLLANHLLSAIDAFISHRLGRRATSVEVRSTIWGARDGPESIGVRAVVSVGF